MSNKLLTVFTPTYNRAHTLVRTYESLCRQTCDDFEWIIIDDGSTDNTEDVVESWLEEKKIPIRYYKKENGGLLSGYNKALEHIETELNVCIDSDDFMPDDAVQIIKEEWRKINDENIAGIIGLDFDIKTNKPIGGIFKYEGDYHYEEKIYVVKHICDSKIVCRTDLMKQLAPLNTFGEKHFNPIHYYRLLGGNYKFHLVNKCLCVVDYQPDGMMAGIFRQYKQSPKSNCESRRITMRSPFIPLSVKYKSAIHYVSSSIFARDYKFLKTTPNIWLTIVAIPLGILLNCYVRYKCYKQRGKKYLV